MCDPKPSYLIALTAEWQTLHEARSLGARAPFKAIEVDFAMYELGVEPTFCAENGICTEMSTIEL